MIDDGGRKSKKMASSTNWRSGSVFSEPRESTQDYSTFERESLHHLSAGLLNRRPHNHGPARLSERPSSQGGAAGQTQLEILARDCLDAVGYSTIAAASGVGV